jgi:hypothetical protein
VAYHISPETTQCVLSIHDSLTYKFIDIHVHISQLLSSYLTTPLGLPECTTGLTQGLTSISKG